MKVHSLLKIATVAAGVGLATRSLLRSHSYDFANKVVLITGGSRGLGLVLAREFVPERARIAICARDEQELERARMDLEDRGADVIAIKCDVTENSEVREMIDVVRHRFGRIDVLVNNASVIQVGPVEVMTVADFQQAMRTHFWGPLNTILAVLPEMRRRNEGRIVNISSIGGQISVPHLLPYSASKFALVGMSKGLRAELAKDGIVVTTVCPGLMRTGSPRNADFKGKHRAEYAWFSIFDALPFTSIKAERAARQIIHACKTGRAELIISVQAKAAVVFDALFPELSEDLLTAVNQLLPKPGGLGETQAKGSESTSFWSPSLLTTLNERAALKNNEIAG
ncbi:MAG TPA: SDR family oxidoreductase [Pyrinomonadaceae bacterium]|jgi:NAD(P)-dependent dehydrogenase (short-subunit alcohol dehydrogenase family)|nr:SDR family oxidoreductase [Pyrinomonadaceae bacterium]